MIMKKTLKIITRNIIILQLISGAAQAQQQQSLLPARMTSPTAFTLFGRSLSDAAKDRKDMAIRDILVTLYSHLPTATRGQRDDILRYKNQFEEIYDVNIDDIVKQQEEALREQLTKGLTPAEEARQLQQEIDMLKTEHAKISSNIDELNRQRELRHLLRETAEAEEARPPAEPIRTIQQELDSLNKEIGQQAKLLTSILDSEKLGEFDENAYNNAIGNLETLLNQYIAKAQRAGISRYPLLPADIEILLPKPLFDTLIQGQKSTETGETLPIIAELNAAHEQFLGELVKLGKPSEAATKRLREALASYRTQAPGLGISVDNEYVRSAEADLEQWGK